ncbi:MAG TPA: hypothetical protein VMU81_27830 [Acetobacteraceae bacterium]|jgi:hypothetical protein|nr:hypothetical protein [Acetobacteraceae bacterium]
MSMSLTAMNKMGSTNTHWGVCGFTSSFYSMYELNPGKRALLIGAGIASRVLAEIKTYLMTLKANGNTTLLQEIEAFTKSFGVVGSCNFGNFRIDNYIASINNAVGRSDADIKADGNFSIAMPPAAVADYLKEIWETSSETQVVKGGDGGTEEAIIGVANGQMQMYDGLCHYMYRSGGKIYSWGQVFGSVAEADPSYRVCRVIKIKKQ